LKLERGFIERKPSANGREGGVKVRSLYLLLMGITR